MYVPICNPRIHVYSTCTLWEYLACIMYHFNILSDHLSHSVDVLLWVGVRRPSCIVSRTTVPIFTKFGMQHLQGMEIVATPPPPPPPPPPPNQQTKRDKTSVKYFYKNPCYRTDYLVFMIKEVSTEIVNFENPCGKC